MRKPRRDDAIYESLCGLVDPLKPPPDSFSMPSAEMFRRMLAIARLHNVLGIVLNKLQGMRLHYPEVWDIAARSWLAHVSQAIRVRRHAQLVLAKLGAADVPAVLFKGADFAEALYPNPRLRPTFDIDVLIPAGRWDEAVLALEACGHVEKRNQAPMGCTEGVLGERTWLFPNASCIEVDMHWNLIDLPSYRKKSSMEYHDLHWLAPPSPACPHGQFSPATRLVVAAVHATHHHQFERMLVLVDLQQAARHLADPNQISNAAALAEKTRTSVAVDISLAVAARLLSDPALDTLRGQIAQCGKSIPVPVPDELFDDAKQNLYCIRSDIKSPSRLRIRQWLRDAS